MFELKGVRNNSFIFIVCYVYIRSYHPHDSSPILVGMILNRVCNLPPSLGPSSNACQVL